MRGQMPKKSSMKEMAIDQALTELAEAVVNQEGADTGGLSNT
jgi:hypothetical protein